MQKALRRTTLCGTAPAWLLLLPVTLAKPRCVFLHGIGVRKTAPTDSHDFDAYWGGDANIASFTPYCASRTFVHQDTVVRGWDNDEVQLAYCAAAVGVDKSDGVIRDTIVITHSMGNNVFGGALLSRKCSMDDSSRWISLSAPWEGSKAAGWVSVLCTNKTNVSTSLHWLAEELSYCNKSHPGQVNHAYTTLAPGYPGLMDVRQLATSRVDAAICGDNAFGLTGEYSVPLELLSNLVPFNGKNDGMVGVPACMLPGRVYNDTYESVFYLASVNHADTTCQDGNGAFGYASRRPCQWLSQRSNVSLWRHAETLFV